MLLVLEDVERERHRVDDAERLLVCRKRAGRVDLLVTLAWTVNLVEIEQHRTSQYTILLKRIESRGQRANNHRHAQEDFCFGTGAGGNCNRRYFSGHGTGSGDSGPAWRRRAQRGRSGPSRLRPRSG